MNDISILWHLIEQGRKGENIGASTGLPKLDKILGGIQSSRYYLVGAGSSVGKSALMIFIMYNLLKNMSKKEPIYLIYFSLELGSEVILEKLMGLYIAENFGKYITFNEALSFETPLGDKEYECLKQVKKWIESIQDHIIIIDTMLNAGKLYKHTIDFALKHGTLQDIEGKKRYIPNNPKQKIIGILDHMSLLHASEGRKIKEEIDLTSQYMVTLKRNFLVSWFALMQQNRDASSMDRRKADLSEPGLSDLKDSGSPSQDADCVIQLFYPFREKLSTYRGYKILGDDGMQSFHRSIIISKNRYGIANQVINCSFYGSVGWFNELDKPENIKDFSIYRDESKNIPCKIQKDSIVEDKPEQKESGELNYSFKF